VEECSLVNVVVAYTPSVSKYVAYSFYPKLNLIKFDQVYKKNIDIHNNIIYI
jgi:hypothetical protein